jgi:drug/metabolite transporter (DMT)-like permease
VPYLGEFCALVAPLCWSVAIVFYRRSSVAAPAQSMTLFKNTLATLLLLATMAAAGISFPTDRSAFDWARLAASGILGLAVGDTLLFLALARIGAARVAIVDTVYAPAVVGLSFLFLGDTLGLAFLAGAAMVLGGVLIANRRQDSGTTVDATRGTLFGLGAIAATSIGVILSKPVLESSDLVEVTCTRIGFGVLAQAAWVTLTRDRDAWVAFRPSSGVWPTLVPATLVGTYLSLLFWMGGFKWAPASVAAVLNQLATVYILVLARVVLKERVAAHQVGGGLLAAAGALVVVLSRA